MHEVLATSELLRLIFEFSSSNHSNALVCKTWCHEALSVIWSDLDCFVNLLQLLAPMAEHESGKLIFSRRLHPKDWVRFHRYSWRVRKVEGERGYMSTLGVSIFSDIASTRPAADLLPNLRVLAYDLAPPAFLPIFLHSNVREVSLFYALEGKAFADEAYTLSYLHDLATAVTYIPSRCPHLESFEFSGRYVFSPILPVSFFQEILSAGDFTRLKRLRLPFLHPYIFHSIASLAMLEDLTVEAWNPSTSFTAYTLAIPNNSFVALKTLSMSSYLFPVVLHLLENVALPHLVAVKLTTRNGRMDSGDCYDRFFSALGRNFPGLRKLAIHSQGSVKVEFSAFQHVLRCANLEVIEFDGAPSVQFDGDNIMSIVQSLPLLRSLTLSNVPPPPPLYAPDLFLLSDMIPYCHNLEFLGLTLTVQSRMPDIITPVSKLLFCDLGRSVGKDPKAIATFLSAVSPSNRKVRLCRNTGFWVVIAKSLKESLKRKGNAPDLLVQSRTSR